MYKFYDIPGYTDVQDFNFLEDVIGFLPNNGTMLEIGTMLGRSTMFFAETFRKTSKDFKIYSIDLFPKNISHQIKLDAIKGDISYLQQLACKSSYELSKDFLRNYDEVTIIKHNLFWNIPKELSQKKLSFIFEDSEHTIQSTQQCLDIYYPKLISSGIYCGDDYDWPQVKKCVDFFVKKNNLELFSNGKIWFFKKP